MNNEKLEAGLASDLNRELEAFKRGARAMFDALAMRAANHWHSSEEINKVCDAENKLVMDWAEDALDEVDPEDCATWRELSKLSAENWELKQKIKEFESKL